MTFDLNAPAVNSPVTVLNGLSAQATFVLDTGSPTILKIDLANTSTGVPAGFDSSDQILTGISWDFGDAGFRGADPAITGGSVVIGPGGGSLNFSNVATQLGPGDDVSGEYGYGNMDGTGALANFVSGNTAQATPFGGPNLDGPPNIDGPQGGIVTNPPQVSLGGLGAVFDSVHIELTIDTPLSNLDFLTTNGVRAEFGSDAAFLTVPEPASALLLGLGAVVLTVRPRRRFFPRDHR